MLSNEQKELLVFLLITILLALSFSFALFGVIGARVALGIIFISFPFYLVLNNFELAEGEKFIFSVLLGLTIFPSLVYLLGLVMSFRIAIAVAFIALVGIAIIHGRYKLKTQI